MWTLRSTWMTLHHWPLESVSNATGDDDSNRELCCSFVCACMQHLFYVWSVSLDAACTSYNLSASCYLSAVLCVTMWLRPQHTKKKNCLSWCVWQCENDANKKKLCKRLVGADLSIGCQGGGTMLPITPLGWLFCKCSVGTYCQSGARERDRVA